MPLGPRARSILGLPEPGEWEQKKARTRAKRDQKPAPAAAVNPWESAARQLKEQRSASPTATATAAPKPAPEPDPEPAAPWATVDERSGSAFARKFGRGVLWALVALLVLVGLKALLVPKKPAAAPPPATGQTAPAYPTDEAQAVAGRFARAYLSWDEKDPTTRAAGLAAVLPEGSDTAMGWDGKGRQDVLAVEPGAVTPTTQQQARVRVDVLIRPAAEVTTTPPPAKPATPGTPAPPAAPAVHWIGLEIPVVQTAGRVVVTGAPGIVGVPKTGPKAPTLRAPETDAEFSTQTTQTVERFFAAYAGGDTESVTAPGATVPPLPVGVTLVGVTSWSADRGTGSDRSGTARVTYRLAGAQIEQTYRIQLTRVASADAQRWQVAGVHGSTA
ncbi:conjugal transfer protein [Streptomyces hydrogenans]|uniref:conjugal transfer protein n=1 Tax=Streptomyces hydrogenans TaxID=1873719 RepID=UPI003D7249FC